MFLPPSFLGLNIHHSKPFLEERQKVDILPNLTKGLKFDISLAEESKEKRWKGGSMKEKVIIYGKAG
jgi:hypothetical protein